MVLYLALASFDLAFEIQLRISQRKLFQRSSMAQYRFCSTYVIYVPLQRHFSVLESYVSLTTRFRTVYVSITGPDCKSRCEQVQKNITLCFPNLGWTQDNKEFASVDISQFSQHFMSVRCCAVQVVSDERSQVTGQFISAKSKIYLDMNFY